MTQNTPALWGAGVSGRNSGTRQLTIQSGGLNCVTIE